AGQDGTARVWNALTRERISPDLKHDGVVNRAEFGPDGTLLATATQEGTVHVWDVHSGRDVLPPAKLGDAVRTMAFHSRKQLLIQRADYVVRVWDLASGKLRAPSGPANPRYSVVSDDGQVICSWDGKDQGIVVDVASGTATDLPRKMATGDIRGAFSSDGRRLGLADTRHAVWLWDVSNRSWIGEPIPHTRQISCLCLNLH